MHDQSFNDFTKGLYPVLSLTILSTPPPLLRHTDITYHSSEILLYSDGERIPKVFPEKPYLGL